MELTQDKIKNIYNRINKVQGKKSDYLTEYLKKLNKKLDKSK